MVKYTILRFNDIPLSVKLSTIFRIDGIDRGSIMYRGRGEGESHELERGGRK